MQICNPLQNYPIPVPYLGTTNSKNLKKSPKSKKRTPQPLEPLSLKSKKRGFLDLDALSLS